MRTFRRTSMVCVPLIYRGLVLLAGLGLAIGSVPIEHSHEGADQAGHGLHVHAHEDHAHHDHHAHHAHHTHHEVPTECASRPCSGDASDHESHVHMLVLDLDLPGEVIFELPRPERIVLETPPLPCTLAHSHDDVRIPDARGPPVG